MFAPHHLLRIALALAVAACGGGAATNGEPPGAGGGSSSSGASGSGSSGDGGPDDGSAPLDGSSGGSSSGGSSGSSGGSGGLPITCPAPGSYKQNGGACGSERWDIKTGTDPGVVGVSLVPTPTTIAALTAIPAAGGGASRSAPVEQTLWELTDVTLSIVKLETDSDYHLVVSDAGHTMIVEIPYPPCAVASKWGCFLSRARAEVDAHLNVTASPQYPALTVTVRGVGFFDFPHGQNGVAPNAIELHAVLQLCFGKGCTPT